MKPSQALVTGGAGFIGSQVVDALIERGWAVHVVDDLSTGNTRNINPKATFVRTNVAHPRVQQWIAAHRPAAVFHFAAQISVSRSVKDPVKDAETNINATLKLLEAASRAKVKRFVFAGSGGALCSERMRLPANEIQTCEPASPYAIAKRTIEYYGAFYREHRNLPFVSLRFANVYGPRQSPHGEAGVIAIFTLRMLHNRNTRINGTGKQTRDYIYVDDVVRAVLLMLDHPDLAGPYNVGTGIETSVKHIHSMLAKIIGYTKTPGRGPADTAAPLRSALDASRLTHDAHWHWDVGLREGLQRTVDWFREHEYGKRNRFSRLRFSKGVGRA